MYDFLIKKYVERLTKEDIKNYAVKEGIVLTDKENTIIYDYIKKYWRTFYYGNPRTQLDELKELLSEETYKKIENLYIDAKRKLDNIQK